MALGLAIDQAQSHNSLGDLFDGQLANLSRAAPWGNPYLGGQSLNHCCALAVNDSLELHNGTVFFRPGQTTMTGTVEDFLSAPFPCDAEYDGSTAFPPQVWITYIWCQHNCDGWAAPWIDIYSLRFWLKPLVLFIIPSTVFSLNIPRRRRMGVPRWLFPRRLSSISDLLTLSYKVPIAALIVTVDMLIWTLIILTMSGPMLLSGIYEAVLDQRILDFVTNRIKRNSLTIRQRAHLLLIILFGSLDLDHAWGELRTTISDLPNDNLRRRSSQATVVSSPQTHVSLRSRSDVGSMNSISTGRKSRRPAEYTSTTKSHINAMKAKLRSVMQSQLTFGTAAGAAIIFYSGNFAYILLEIREDFGDPDMAHQLAFGMMWMAIPHVAIIGSLLLACHSPHTLKAIVKMPLQPLTFSTAPVSDVIGDATEDQIDVRKKICSIPWLRLFPPVFGPTYMTASMWNRGQAKRKWISKFVEEYPAIAESIENEVLKHNFKSLAFSAGFPASFLACVPCFLGGMISYTTPAIGLGCKSLTLLVYGSSQCVLILLWQIQWVSQYMNEIPPVTGQGVQLHLICQCLKPIWFLVFALVVFTSFFSGIMGTAFILMGLYKNCLCLFPAQYWLSLRHDTIPRTFLSNVSFDQVYYAKHYWIPTGIATTCFLITMTYVGWWYSRRMRNLFNDCVDEIDALDVNDLAEHEDVSPSSLHRPNG